MKDSTLQVVFKCITNKQEQEESTGRGGVWRHREVLPPAAKPGPENNVPPSQASTEATVGVHANNTCWALQCNKYAV